MASPALKSAVLSLAIGIVVLDAIAIAIYYLADVPLRPASIRYPFFAVWMLLTFAIVLPALHRIRMARRRGRYGPKTEN
jgi:hypothetical protein